MARADAIADADVAFNAAIGQHGLGQLGPDLGQKLERSAEEGGVGQHAHDVGALAVTGEDRAEVGDGTDRTG